jgi:hypothetical protein
LRFAIADWATEKSKPSGAEAQFFYDCRGGTSGTRALPDYFLPRAVCWKNGVWISVRVVRGVEYDFG